MVVAALIIHGGLIRPASSGHGGRSVASNIPSAVLFTQDQPQSVNASSCSFELSVLLAAIVAISLRICCRVHSNVRRAVSAPLLKHAAPTRRARRRNPRPSFVERVQIPDDLARLLWGEHG